MESLIRAASVPMVHLYAVPGKDGFYERLGFRRMKTAFALFPNPESHQKNGYLERIGALVKITSESKQNTMNNDEDYGGVLGLEHNSNCLHDATPLWAQFYLQEENIIRDALSTLLVDIQHYGSTSVPGIKAKPILDIIVGIKDFEQGLQCIAPLEAVGYEYAPQAGIPGDYTFGKGSPRTHLVHVVEYRGSNWKECLFFRDALRRDPDLAHQYEELKVTLAEQFSSSRADYTEAKTDFIRNVISAT